MSRSPEARQPGDPVPDAWRVPLVGLPVRVDGAATGVLAGFSCIVDLTPPDDFFDWQGHLNNAFAAKLLESARVTYLGEGVGAEFRRRLWESAFLVVRELHVSYETEGFPDDEYRCGIRVASRTEKSFTIEQVLIDRATQRVIVRAWLVMLIVGRDTERVIPIPDWYWQRVEQLEGRAIPPDTAAPRRRWGPPS